MNHKIDICFFIYNNKSEKCLSFLPVLDYPKHLINVSVFSDREIKHEYKHFMIDEKDAYNFIRLQCAAEYVWLINADYIIQSTSILKDLINTNLSITSGLLVEPGAVFSNFWGAVSETGWYERSENYLSIVNREVKGAFDVPYITGNILFKAEVFRRNDHLVAEHKDWDLDMNLCHNLRTNNEHMFLINNEVYGYIEETKAPKDSNMLGPWTADSCLHPDFKEFLLAFKKEGNKTKTGIFKELGPDIWQFPIFKEEFCDYLVDLAEKKNEWSGGVYSKKNEIDPRLGAIEHFPTQDIHLKQLDLHDWWLNKVVGEYFKSVLSYLYSYQTKGYNISFIVKYTPDGQARLDPHHDSSAYTTNIALNTYGSDYMGGGCNFVHKKIECIGNLKGHVIMHPGRITHYHEAYPVQTGTRYILVSFNN